MSALPPSSPSSRQLARATLAAIAIAGILLLTVVLPAEFGRDPTGVGQATGLFRAPESAVATSAPTANGGPVTIDPLFKSSAPYRSDEMTLTLKSGEGAEIKAAMGRGDRIVFAWTASGGDGVDVDMHGEGTGSAQGRTTSYWKDEGQKNGNGALEATFPGNHGWFWQNLTDDPVTITVRISGFYEKLFRP